MRIEIDGNNNVHIVDRGLDYIAIHNLAPDMVQRLQTANLNPDKLAQAEMDLKGHKRLQAHERKTAQPRYLQI